MPASLPQAVGKYQVLDRLAVGGMAELLKARVQGQHGFEKMVALKKILPHLATDASFVEMFFDEARLTVIPPSIDAFSPKNQMMSFTGITAVLRAAGLAAPLAQHGEVAVHLVQQRLALRLGHLGAVEPGPEILEHGEEPEDAPVLRDEADAGAGDPVRRPAGDVDAPEDDATRLGRREAHDRAHGGRLPHAVAAEQAHALAGGDVDRDAEEHPGQPVGGVERVRLEQRGAGRSHRRSPR